MPGVEVRARSQEQLDEVMRVLDQAIAVGLTEWAPRIQTPSRIMGQISYKAVEVVEPPRKINYDVEIIISTKMIGLGYLNQSADAVRGALAALLDFPLWKLKVRVRSLWEGDSSGSGYSRA